MYKRVVKTFSDLVTGDVINFGTGAYGDMTITKIERMEISNFYPNHVSITAFRAYVHFDDEVGIAYIGTEWVRDLVRPLDATLDQYEWKVSGQVSDTEINLRTVRQNPRLAREFTDIFHNIATGDNLQKLADKIIAAGGSRGR